jgi:hypothetical protein
MDEQIVFGMEDLYNLGDQDYNDMLFTVSASPFDALDVSSMPTGAPEAGPLATALISASLFAAYARRRRRVAGPDARPNGGGHVLADRAV